MSSAENSCFKKHFQRPLQPNSALHSSWYTFDAHGKVDKRGFHVSDSDLDHPIPSTVPNNVHLCRQLSWCAEIIHGQ